MRFRHLDECRVFFVVQDFHTLDIAVNPCGGGRTKQTVPIGLVVSALASTLVVRSTLARSELFIHSFIRPPLLIPDRMGENVGDYRALLVEEWAVCEWVWIWWC